MHGFQLEKGILRREKENGFEKIAYESLEPYSGGKFKLTYSAIKRLNAVEEIWDQFFLETKPLGVGSSYVNSTLAFNAERICNYTYDPGRPSKWFYCKDRYEVDATEEGLHELLMQFLENIRLYVIPTFDRFDSLVELDRFVNKQPDTFFEAQHLLPGGGLMYKKMIIAKLAGNRKFEAVSAAVRKRIEDTEEEEGDLPKVRYLSVFEKLFAYLKKV